MAQYLNDGPLTWTRKYQVYGLGFQVKNSESRGSQGIV